MFLLQCLLFVRKMIPVLCAEWLGAEAVRRQRHAAGQARTCLDHERPKVGPAHEGGQLDLRRVARRAGCMFSLCCASHVAHNVSL